MMVASPIFHWDLTFDGLTPVSCVDPFDGRRYAVPMEVTPEQYQAYLDGALIQDAFPQLSVEEREFLLTGLYGDFHWKDYSKYYPDDDELLDDDDEEE